MSSRRLAAVAVVALALFAAFTAAPTARAATAPVTWSAPVLAEHALATTPTVLAGVGCEQHQLPQTCAAVGAGGTVVVLDDGQPIVQRDVAGGADLTHIACTSFFCVTTTATAVFRGAAAFAPLTPWTQTATAPAGTAFAGITCGGESGPCVAWTTGGAAEVSADGRTWVAEQIVPAGSGLQVAAVACTEAKRCLASVGESGASSGRLATAVDPAGAAGAWTLGDPTTFAPLDALACGDNELGMTGVCVGTTAGGAVVTTRDPDSATPSWSATQVIPAGDATQLAGVACQSATLCVAPLGDGRVATITPAGTTLSPSVVDASGFSTDPSVGVACETTGPCLAPDLTPGLASLDVGVAPVTAAVAPGLGLPSLTGLACPASNLCLALDGGGAILRTATPGGPATGWRRTVQPSAGRGLLSIACAAQRLCVAGGVDDELLTSTRPGSGSRWRARLLGFSYRGHDDGEDPDDIDALACPATRLCVAVATADPSDGYPDQSGLIASADPAGPASTWRNLRVSAKGGLACPTVRLCVAGSTRRGRIVVSTHPDRGGRAWRAVTVGTAPLTSIACPSVRLCLAGDRSGILHWSTHPTGGAHAWHETRLGARPLSAIACRSAHLCLVTTAADTVDAATRPTGGVTAWHATTLSATSLTTPDPPAQSVTALACAPAGPCLAGTSLGTVFPGA